jgi:chromosome segregation ATPase
MAVENLTAAVQALQEAEADLVAATKTISEHNTDETAHQDIRDAIDALKEVDAIYTKTEIEQLINEKVDAHTELTYDKAHPGWSDYETALQSKLTQLTTAIEELQDKLAGKEQEDSDLQTALQEIEDKYAPIIENISKALQAAEEAGNDDLADQYKTTLKETLDQKTKELIAATEKWQSEHAS